MTTFEVYFWLSISWFILWNQILLRIVLVNIMLKIVFNSPIWNPFFGLWSKNDRVQQIFTFIYQSINSVNIMWRSHCFIGCYVFLFPWYIILHGRYVIDIDHFIRDLIIQYYEFHIMKSNTIMNCSSHYKTIVSLTHSTPCMYLMTYGRQFYHFLSDPYISYKKLKWFHQWI